MNPVTQQIIDGLNIEEVVREFYPADKLDSPSNGWFNIRALDRDDNNPSAGINLISGVYNDFGNLGSGGVALFDWLVRAGSFSDWKDARSAMAKKVGVKIPTKGLKKADSDERWEDIVIYSPKTILQNPLYVRGLCKRRQGLTPEALHAFGAKAARYNNIHEDSHSTQQKINSVVVLPIYNVHVSHPILSPITGATIFPNNGRYVYLSNGESKKQHNRGKAGIIGLHGIEILTHPEKRKNIIKVLKTEGPSCAMTLWAAMDPEDRDRFPIVTNSSGAGETVNLNGWANLFIDLDIVTIHDSDRPGQEGVKNWQEKVGPFCKTFSNVVLHDEIVDKRGPDLRDWINNGGTWLELKAMILNATPLVVSDRQAILDMSDTDRVLNQIKCTVIGDLGGHHNKIQIYTGFRRDYFEIIPAHLNDYQVSQYFGKAVGRQVMMGTLAIEQIRGAIAEKCSECGKVNLHNRIGPGIWCSRDKDRLAVVGEQGLFVYDEAGGLELQEDPHFDGRAALLRLDNFSESWFDLVKLAKYTRMAHDDKEWSISVMYELNNLFCVWDNLKHGSDDALLLSGLTVATLLQDIWEIRPQVWISGPTDSGKSHMTRVFEWMFGPLMARMDAPTEAGFRNAIQNQKRFVTIDEFEKSDHRRKIIATLRTTTKGGDVLRATADHRSVSFVIKHLPWFTGTNRGFEKFAADSNRVIKIDLGEPTPEQYARGQTFPSRDALCNLGHKLIAVAIVHWKKMLEVETALGRLSIPGTSHRLVECYAVPVAVHAAVMGLDGSGVEELLTEVLEARGDDVKQTSQADETRMLEFILNQPILYEGANVRLWELVKNEVKAIAMLGSPTPLQTAQIHGVGILDNGDWVFHDATIVSRQWWRTSEYVGVGIKESLSRLVPSKMLHNGKLTSRTRQATGQYVWCVRVPEQIMQQFIGKYVIETGFPGEKKLVQKTF